MTQSEPSRPCSPRSGASRPLAAGSRIAWTLALGLAVALTLGCETKSEESGEGAAAEESASEGAGEGTEGTSDGPAGEGDDEGGEDDPSEGGSDGDESGDPAAATADGSSDEAGGADGDDEEDGGEPDEGESAGPTAEGDKALLVAQSQFTVKDGEVEPGAAKLVILRPVNEAWQEEVLEDPESNVFHKAIPWRDGILTIGAMKARLVHWTRGEGGDWTPTLLWEQSWGGKFDRLRDLEIGDVTGDGAENLVIGTHDQGVVAVGTEGDDGTWTFEEMDQQPDTFVHEIEIGDVDGDGALEFYATVSGRNRTDMVSQSGDVYRYAMTETGFERTQVVGWTDTHAKEILVADIDDDGRDDLYVAREAVTKAVEGAEKTEVVEPVQIVQMWPDRETGEWTERRSLEIDDRQLRFLAGGDLDGDGDLEMVASAMTAGIFLVDHADGALEADTIAKDSGGFEHSTYVADIDGRGGPEIYVAADREQRLDRYMWTGATWEKETVDQIPSRHITWNLTVGPVPPAKP